MIDESNEWIMDVTNYPEYVSFSPYEDDSVILGMTYISDKCPGTIVGVMHFDGPEMSNKFIEEHPNLREEFELNLVDQITPDNINIDKDWEKLE